MASVIVGAIVCVLAGLAVRSLWKNRKNGGCSCGCAGCSHSCHGCEAQHK